MMVVVVLVGGGSSSVWCQAPETEGERPIEMVLVTTTNVIVESPVLGSPPFRCPFKRYPTSYRNQVLRYLLEEAGRQAGRQLAAGHLAIQRIAQYPCNL
ncbi:hypothetical protein M0802_006783 [Mischocyttarus mexicanus]|nr:hypothetical protein M0802_006783 [Mischocyttarus mexicanus]